MIHQVFSIRDSKADAWLQPFFSPNQATAMRSMREHLSDPSQHLAKHAEDFNLFVVGSYDDGDGTLTGVPPEHVCQLVALLPQG